ncbi:hypothetical protein WSM22_21930 [Cytophagales bacterium WSM2-2]|nr:hypothetical protein WSM22_21930 [Cytophagales bacterium WSM2-2]
MKKILVLLMLIVITATTSMAREKQPKKQVRVISTKQKTLFFKVRKAFVGGLIEVFDANNNFLEGEGVPHTHNKVHFEDAPAGVYTVIISKGNKSIELSYENM